MFVCSPAVNCMCSAQDCWHSVTPWPSVDKIMGSSHTVELRQNVSQQHILTSCKASIWLEQAFGTKLEKLFILVFSLFKSLHLSSLNLLQKSFSELCKSQTSLNLLQIISSQKLGPLAHTLSLWHTPNHLHRHTCTLICAPCPPAAIWAIHQAFGAGTIQGWEYLFTGIPLVYEPSASRCYRFVL